MIKGIVSSNKIVILGFAVFLMLSLSGFYVDKLAFSAEEVTYSENNKPDLTEEKIATPSVAPVVFLTPTQTSKPINIKKLTPEELNLFFTKYSTEFNVDEQMLWQIAWCESKFNSQAVNGPYGGMFQFTPSSWASSRRSMGLDPSSGLRFDPQEAIKTAAFKISREGTRAWPVCGR